MGRRRAGFAIVVSRSALILAGEPSGDRVAGQLAHELRVLDPDLRIAAVGGPSLRAAGAEIIRDIGELSAMGFAEVVRQIPRLRRLELELRAFLDEARPSVVVPVDYPGFNLRIAAHAKGLGIPVVYYVSPQIWAWGGGRLSKIARVVDRMIVVFAFEERIYRRAGVPVEFVGHPLLERLAGAPRREEARADLGLTEEAPVLGLLPGSRGQEVRRILPVMLATARRLQREFPALVTLVSVAASVPASEYADATGEGEGGALRTVTGPADAILAAADVLLVTSGTATLEAAVMGTPLAVLYRTSWPTWMLGRLLVRIPRISLVNIVAGEDLVPEFLQGQARPDAITTYVRALLADPDRRVLLAERLRGLRARLGAVGASRRAARIILAEARS
jgi:lipid-A-disaccharide synthase